MRAAFITAHGGPECLAVEDAAVPTPAAGHVLVQVAAAGLNFHDVIERRSGYPGQPAPPIRTGLEGAGTVVAVGPGVVEPAVGDRVAWAAVPGSHAQFVEVPADVAIPMPAWLDPVEAAAVCAQGLTAHYLANSLRPMAVGETALVWAAAGGVGRLLTQFLAAKGVRVIAATSNAAKAAAAHEAGAEWSVHNSEIPEVVADVTGGAGVDVVFDGIGAPTFEASLASVRRRGLLVVYGRAGGQVPPVDLFRLSSAGSVQLVRPRLADFVASRKELVQRARELFEAIRDDQITVRVEARYPLEKIADAHRHLESGAVIGKIIVLPGA
ncbi:quinone oxidoreductase [Nocardia vinacea]|uniref:quinone oxidoreductase family protein n=1 Tax=Nocardia vinacea TaxID=96468 RepID=UPI0034385EE7